jgi:hypothetical protein
MPLWRDIVQPEKAEAETALSASGPSPSAAAGARSRYAKRGRESWAVRDSRKGDAFLALTKEKKGVSSRASGSRRTFHRPPRRRHHHTPPRACRWQTRVTRAAVRWTRSCASPSVRSRQILACEVPGASRVHGTIAERLSRLPTRVAPAATSVGNAGSWPGLTSVPGWVRPRQPRGVF